MPLRLSALDKKYVLVPVSIKADGEDFDPTADVVRMAFLSDMTASPGDSDWKTASWEDGGGTVNVYYARCLVGPSGAVTLTANDYAVWVKITDNPEIVVQKVDTLTIF